MHKEYLEYNHIQESDQAEDEEVIYTTLANNDQEKLDSNQDEHQEVAEHNIIEILNDLDESYEEILIPVSIYVK